LDFEKNANLSGELTVIRQPKIKERRFTTLNSQKNSLSNLAQVTSQ